MPVEGHPGWMVSIFFFETKVGRSTGMLRLTQDCQSGTYLKLLVDPTLSTKKERLKIGGLSFFYLY